YRNARPHILDAACACPRRVIVWSIHGAASDGSGGPMSECRRVAAIGECMIELTEAGGGAGGGGGEGTRRRGVGGDTLNTAVYMARLGAAAGIAVDYVSALGDDPFSDALVAAWEAEGIGTRLVARLPGRLPGLYAIRNEPNGERSFWYWRSASTA